MNDFIKEVVESIQKLYPCAEVKTDMVSKTNDKKVNGLMIISHQNGIIPVIYLEPYYE